MPLSAWARLHIGVIGRRIQRPEQLDFTGQELADIIAFAHDPREQRKFSEADVPWALRRLDLAVGRLPRRDLRDHTPPSPNWAPLP